MPQICPVSPELTVLFEVDRLLKNSVLALLKNSVLAAGRIIVIAL
jgi:hypothetical protein